MTEKELMMQLHFEDGALPCLFPMDTIVGDLARWSQELKL